MFSKNQFYKITTLTWVAVLKFIVGYGGKYSRVK